MKYATEDIALQQFETEDADMQKFSTEDIALQQFETEVNDLSPWILLTGVWNNDGFWNNNEFWNNGS